MAKQKYWDGTKWVQLAPSMEEFNNHKNNSNIHKTSTAIRGETGQLRVEVTSSFPTRADGCMIYHTEKKQFFGRSNGEWV